MSAGNIQKTVARLQERITEGQYYEAQQQARVVAARHVKSRKWGAAVDLLHSVARALLVAGQGGSAGDLCVLMVDVLEKGEVGVDAASKGKVLELLRLFGPGEPTRKRFVGLMIGCVPAPFFHLIPILAFVAIALVFISFLRKKHSN